MHYLHYRIKKKWAFYSYKVAILQMLFGMCFSKARRSTADYILQLICMQHQQTVSNIPLPHPKNKNAKCRFLWAFTATKLQFCKCCLECVSAKPEDQLQTTVIKDFNPMGLNNRLLVWISPLPMEPKLTSFFCLKRRIMQNL